MRHERLVLGDRALGQCKRGDDEIQRHQRCGQRRHPTALAGADDADPADARCQPLGRSDCSRRVAGPRMEVGGGGTGRRAGAALVVHKDGHAPARQFVLPHRVVGGGVVVRPFDPHREGSRGAARGQHELAGQHDPVAGEGGGPLHQPQALPLLDKLALRQPQPARAAGLELDRERAARPGPVREFLQVTELAVRESEAQAARLAVVARDDHRPLPRQGVGPQQASQFRRQAGWHDRVERRDSRGGGSGHDDQRQRGKAVNQPLGEGGQVHKGHGGLLEGGAMTLP